MKNKKFTIGFIISCLLIVTVLTVIHLSSRPEIPPHHVMLERGDKIEYIDVDSFQMLNVEGETVNQKGEIKKISGKGILLRNALAGIRSENFDNALVISDDEYHASVTWYEIYDTDSVYLLREDDGIRLFISEDNDSKRNVSNVVKIVLTTSE